MTCGEEGRVVGEMEGEGGVLVGAQVGVLEELANGPILLGDSGSSKIILWSNTTNPL